MGFFGFDGYDDPDDDRTHRLTEHEFMTLRKYIGTNWEMLIKLIGDVERQNDDLNWRITMLEHKLSKQK